MNDEEMRTPDFDPEENDREIREREEREIGPYRAAAQQRKESAAIIAEHDDILAELMFNDTMRELEG